ncbi:hypothetical protein [Leucobacter sp. M11]|uniref:hypothetical protein n=1 Tax=Leucobacter sp. M11 TaxID=2993565 RepID=UPI002D7FC159|nr:hypothetical protein [Leucobacter sp. M11]MEB4615957.1 hypothetical protein [Leucobacter sp. M11]
MTRTQQATAAAPRPPGSPRQRSRRGRWVSLLGASLGASAGVLLLSGCLVLDSIREGVSGTVDSLSGKPVPELPDDLFVVLELDSDADLAELAVELDARVNPTDTTEQNVTAPATRKYEVDTSVPFPLLGARAELTAGEGATFVACRLIVDGTERASNRVEGPGSTVTCEHRFQLGPG